jgi:uncharacterized membrane protein
MLPLVSRMGIVIIASFTLTMLLAATADWALRQAGGGLPVKLILSVLFPITFFLCSIVMEYIEDGNLAHSVRASLFNTGFAAVVVFILYVIVIWDAFAICSRITRSDILVIYKIYFY